MTFLVVGINMSDMSDISSVSSSAHVPHGGCWLCHNSNHETARQIHKFILQNISTVSSDSIAEMVSQRLVELDPSAHGTCRVSVLRHIQGNHLLDPSLQVAHILRCLLDLRDTLQRMLITEDENGIKTVDARNMSAYLNVVSKIMQVYGAGDISKLLYFNSEK
jgi:hypothetical protein